MNIIVISNIHREPLVTDHIKEFNPIISLTPDWPYPAIGHYRCFHGHTLALKAYMKDETALVFEDDCIPDDRYPWREAIEAANNLVLSGIYDMICLHGRGFDFDQFEKIENLIGFDWLRPKTKDRWVLGTLAYVINKKAAKLFIESDFWLHGTNIDIFLWSYRFNFCLLDPTQFEKNWTNQQLIENPPPFIHGCGAEQSVLQNPKNVECVIR